MTEPAPILVLTGPPGQEQNEVVHRAFTTAAAAYALGGYPVVLDAIVGPWFLPQLVDDAADRPIPLRRGT